MVSSILDSLDSPDPHDSDQDSLTEAVRRGDEIRADEVEAIPEKRIHGRDSISAEVMEINLNPRVRKDIREILKFYDERSDTAGDRFLDEFESALARIKEMPSRFNPLDEKRKRCDLKDFPWNN